MAWRYLLLPLTPLYRGAVAVRHSVYRRGWRRRVELPVPVISIGNLTFGGTGKTPMVVALVRDLIRLGWKPGILTRGHGRSDDSLQVVTGPDPRQGLREVGDEPLEMARLLPGVPIVVNADRGRGGREAIRLGADVVVLDDGFQHLRLERDLDVVLVDAGDPWGGGRLPPLGRLREPVSALARADAVIVTKVTADRQGVVAEIRSQVEDIAPGVTVLASRFHLRRVRLSETESIAVDHLRSRRVFAFAGIGRPGGFVESLRASGAEVVGERWFPDHHPYAPSDLAAIVAAAEAVDAIPVTTAKDAVKLPADAPVWVAEGEVFPVDGDWRSLWAMIPELGR